MRVERLTKRPIIDSQTAGYDRRVHSNINGPALIRVPKWIAQPLGRYYLYFAHHNGDHIRMAYADDLRGPWTIYGGGVLHLEQSRFTEHIASPDVYIDEQRQQIRLYYHGVITPAEQQAVTPEIDEKFFCQQRSRVALSTDGLHFIELPQVIASAYLRVVLFKGAYFGITMPGLIYRSLDGLTDFERGPLLFGNDDAREAYFFQAGQRNPRHFAIQVTDKNLRLFYSLVPGMPESIYYSSVDTCAGDWRTWTVGAPLRLLQPETVHEGAELTLEESRRGWVPEPVRQLRDPAIFEENDAVYLLYSTAGEQGIAIARLYSD
jgi:hypothetical protein